MVLYWPLIVLSKIINRVLLIIFNKEACKVSILLSSLSFSCPMYFFFLGLWYLRRLNEIASTRWVKHSNLIAFFFCPCTNIYFGHLNKCWASFFEKRFVIFRCRINFVLHYSNFSMLFLIDFLFLSSIIFQMD